VGAELRIAPKNWSDFQHYKDRAPPWIKLHKGLLDNFEFHSLQLASRALAPMLWLLASEEKDGVIDKTHEQLAFRLRCTPQEVASAVSDLIDKGFFVSLDDAIKPLAECLQPAVPETERETEVETYKPEAETKTELLAPQGDADGPNPVNLETWKAYKQAYCQRYGVDPVRNKTVNAQIKGFVARLGEEAPEVAAFYLRSNKAFYVQQSHSVGQLLKDAEGLRTQWATGRAVTQAEATMADATQARGNVWEQVRADFKTEKVING
jgi:hypothetical protein